MQKIRALLVLGYCRLKCKGDRKMDKGFFENLFDFDGDGKLDCFERTFEYKAFEALTENDENEEDGEENG